MRWSRVYNFNLGRDVDINEVMAIRNEFSRNDPRAGDLWCHEDCYKNETGFKISSVKESIDKKTGHLKKVAYFRKWKGKHENTDLYCGVKNLADSKRESMDYANFYAAFEVYLQSLTGKKEPYYVSTFTKSELEFEPDFEIIHSQKIGGFIGASKIYIVDENKRRKQKFPNTHINQDTFIITLSISEYTVEQLNDFDVGGIGKFLIKWQLCLKLLEEREKEEAALIAAASEKFEKDQQLEILANARSELREKEKTDHIANKSKLNNILDETMENYYSKLANDWRYNDFIKRTENCLANTELVMPWDTIHTEIKEEYRKLMRDLFDLQFRNGYDRSGRITVELNNKNVAEYGSPIIEEWQYECFAKLENFLDKNVEQYEVYEPKVTLMEIANDRLSQSHEHRQRILKLKEEIDDWRKSNSSRFERRYPYDDQIKQFYLRVSERISYFNAWIDKFTSTPYPSEISENNAKIVKKLITQCNDLLKAKTKEERIFQYHRSGNPFNNTDEFINEVVNFEIFAEFEQCHRMLKMTLGEWKSLPKDKKMEL